ncbi:hypothetical protein CAPTEDRAFT_210648 [Capitella teleta]|uniref:Uncharacterized protein n=1 Tax=Capitella teleta TaxID=283909 RepID=R7ULR8_CAPTE|nr:hypothetical protein CAPTEDRAFT_210648 [Capitella teleta]|eukprot:ELU07145.1 hypothetical protein CAPTEDRAFT_210648 [Capitella teleta]
MSKKYKKRVSVTFAGDDDVHHHIESLNIKKRNFPLKKKEVNDSSEDEASDVSPKDEEEEEEIFRPIASDGEESVGVTGSQVFGFKANKRSHTMAAKVSESIAASPQQKKSQEQSQRNKTSKNIVKTPTRQYLVHEAVIMKPHKPFKKNSLYEFRKSSCVFTRSS